MLTLGWISGRGAKQSGKTHTSVWRTEKVPLLEEGASQPNGFSTLWGLFIQGAK